MGGKALSATDVAKNPFLSPGSLDVPLTIEADSSEKKARRTFEGYPPSYISGGGREILIDEIRLVGKRMQAQAIHKHLPTTTPIANGDHGASSANGHAASDDIDKPSTTKGYEWVTMDEEPEMWHDFVASPFARTEARRTLDGIAGWLAALPPGSDYPV